MSFSREVTITLGMDGPRFYDALNTALSQKSTTLSALCDAAGVSYDRIKVARQRKSNPKLGDAIRIARAFGMYLEDFIEDPERASVTKLPALMEKLTDDERPRVEGFVEGIISVRNVDQSEALSSGQDDVRALLKQMREKADAAAEDTSPRALMDALIDFLDDWEQRIEG